MSPSNHPKIAVVGASLTALTFALSLLHHDPSFSPEDIILFETRPPADQPGGQWYTRGATEFESPTRPLLLTPNSLRLLDKLGVYDHIKDKGYRMSRTIYRDVGGNFLGAATFGGKQEFGYDALRIERMLLFPPLLEALERKGVKIEYHTSVREIISEEHPSGVTFTVRRGRTDSATETIQADLLIGADGIHSETRAHVLGNAMNPTYHGIIMVPFKFDTQKVRYGKIFASMLHNNDLCLGLSTHKGAIMMIPADPSGSPSMSFRQYNYPEQTRAGWEALNADKKRLARMLTEDLEEWRVESDFVASILEQVDSKDCIVWPVYSLPKLERWVSEGGGVVVVGDAAHSLIPAAAQGANVSVEDSWTLARVVSESRDRFHDEKRQALREWQNVRRERIESVQRLSLQLMNARLPPGEMAKLPKDQVFDLESQADDLKWLFQGVD